MVTVPFVAVKRIVVSTSGVPKMIKKMADDNVKFNLAVSLHSAIQETREKIMPFATSFTLTDLKESLEYWYEKTAKQITYEYVVLLILRGLVVI